MRNSNPVSDGGIYALDFLTKKALLSRDIDSQQSVIIGLLCDGGFRETNGKFESLISHLFGHISAQKCFVTEKMRCDVYYFES